MKKLESEPENEYNNTEYSYPTVIGYKKDQLMAVIIWHATRTRLMLWNSKIRATKGSF